jgi:hypothetical protein
VLSRHVSTAIGWLFQRFFDAVSVEAFAFAPEFIRCCSR